MRISSIILCVRNANGSGHEQRRQTDGPGKDEVNRMNDFRKTAQEMLEFIRISPTCFHAVANIGSMLEAAGFQQLQEKEEWKLEKGGRYYTERNDSSVIAFVIPEKEVGIRGFHMAAAHSDSPCFKVKEKPELAVEGALSASEHRKIRRHDLVHLAGQTALRCRETGCEER